jgi:hypothetical protein
MGNDVEVANTWTEGIPWNFFRGTKENNKNTYRYYNLCPWKELNGHILKPSKVLQQFQPKPLIYFLHDYHVLKWMDLHKWPWTAVAVNSF